MAAVVAVIIVLAVIGLVVSALGVRVIQQYERGVVFRVGRLRTGVRDAGLTLIVPVVDAPPVR